MRNAIVATILGAALLAGCFGGSGNGKDEATDDTPEAPFMPRVVIAILDTGLTPYHNEFRQVRAGEDGLAHPSTYLTGYPADAAALPITLSLINESSGGPVTDARAYQRADQDMWNETKAETLYWLPGTKLVGLIGFGAKVPGAGHGSMTTTRAGGNTVSIGGPDTLVIHVVAPLALSTNVGDDEQAIATRWMADQPFIDIQSHSWGMPFTCAGVATQHAWGWAEAFKYARDKQMVAVATANGHGNSGTLGYPSQCQDNSGIAGVVSVGATDNDGYPTWANWFPAVAADGCRNPAIDDSTTDQLENTGGGTSSATPFTAGGAATLVLEARRILRDPSVGVKNGVYATAHEGAVLPATGPLADGDFTLPELKDVLFHTAISPPTVDPSDGDMCVQRVPIGQETPPESVFPLIGYGEVNHASIALGVEVLRGETEMPLRPTEDRIYEEDQVARKAFWG